MTSHNSHSLKRKPCQTKKRKPFCMTSHNSEQRQTQQDVLENENLILLNQKSPLHDIPQLQIAPNSGHMFKTKTLLTSHTLLHHETLKQKQILCQKSTLSNGFEPGTGMSRTQQAQISTQCLTYDWIQGVQWTPGLTELLFNQTLESSLHDFHLFISTRNKLVTLTPSWQAHML